ncbi:hypothetical protein J8F10_02005 [Gemmata sp. G18]|uniref:Uncharacterized protein n=1 Tax=Gemmata palustris TaxID=2822762 RepID=A0ABS5BK36_9BACT|nr:hypothetical protein [Gemmata palustris]MBP3954069.1 hypothetical protein [Gemmata palustris]
MPRRRGSRLRLVAGLGAGAVAMGAFLRISALSLASDSTHRPGDAMATRSTDPHLYALFSESGTWFIAFGALVVALCLVEWARRDPAV